MNPATNIRRWEQIRPGAWQLREPIDGEAARRLMDERLNRVNPPNWRIERPRQAPCLCGCDKETDK